MYISESRTFGFTKVWRLKQKVPYSERACTVNAITNTAEVIFFSCILRRLHNKSEIAGGQANKLLGSEHTSHGFESAHHRSTSSRGSSLLAATSLPRTICSLTSLEKKAKDKNIR